MKKILSLFILVVGLFASSQAQNINDISLVIAPLKFEEQSSYQLLYRRELKKEDWKLRVGLRLLIDTDKVTRTDTIFSNSGTIQYDLSLGLQRDLKLEGWESIKAYVAMDGYWNSDLRQPNSSDYYGYFWNIGVRPTFGVAYEPLKNIRLSFESRANFNVNLQDYNAKGNNAEKRFTFSPLDHLALGLGYLF